MTNYVTAAGVQQWTITIASGSTTGSVNLGTAVGSGAYINFGGINPSVSNDPAEDLAYVSWSTSGGTTTITATRTTGTTGTIVVYGSITDADTSNLVVSVQQGTVTISASTSGTTSVTAPGSDTNTAIHHLGNDSTATSISIGIDITTLTQSSTTVTANVPSSGTTTTGFCLIEFQNSVLTANAVQRFSITHGTTGTSWTQTIASVTTANTLCFLAGYSCATVTTNLAEAMQYGTLTNATTFTVNVNTSIADLKTYNVCIAELNSGVLNSSVQRGTTTLTGVTSNTTTLTAVNESYSGVSWLGNTATATTAVMNEAAGAAALTVATVGIVQQKGAFSNAPSGNTSAVTISPTAGNLLVVAIITSSSAAITVSGVTDNKSQTWVQVPSAAASDNLTGGTVYTTDIWYFPNTAAGVTGVTVTYSGTSTNFQGCTVYELSNAPASSPLDGNGVAVTNGASTNTLTGGDISTSADGDFIVCCFSYSNIGNLFTAMSPYTRDTAEDLSLWHIPVGTVTNEQAQGTISTAKTYCASTAAFLAISPLPDVVKVTKNNATANITGSWEVFEFPAYSAISAVLNAIWFGAIA